MGTTARYETPSCLPTSNMRSSDDKSLSDGSPRNRYSMKSERCLRQNLRPKVASNDTEVRHNGRTNPIRSSAVPVSLKNLKANLAACASQKLSPTSFSDVYQYSAYTQSHRKRNAPGAMPENTRESEIGYLGSQESKQKESFDEQEKEDFRRVRNRQLHRPFEKQQWVLSPASCNNIDDFNQNEQSQQEEQHNTEHNSSFVSVQNIPPPLWTKGFAKQVTNSVKRTVDDTISRGGLLHAPQRKFLSSLTPEDILRSSSFSNEHDEEEDDILGSGSFSKVSKIYIKRKKKDDKNNLPFALKRLKGDLLPSKLTEQSCKNGSVKAFTKAATELAREAFLLSRFDHPHIINIVGWTHGDVTSYFKYRRHDAYFLVLELLREETLEDRIEGWNQKDINLQQISCTQDKIKLYFHRRKIEQLTICRQIASALAYIHSRNVVYRDLKPQNIGFARMGQDSEDDVVVKLMDFGLARELPFSGSLPSCSAFAEQQSNLISRYSESKSVSLFDMTGTVGTIRYMAPEVCLNRPYGLECDVYSWSIVSHEILSQTKPYDDMTPGMYQSVVCQQGVRPPTQNLPSEHTVLLTQAWRTDPSKRLPLHRILRQLDLFIQQEKLIREAQELLLGMPEKKESPIFLSQSYSDENIRTGHGCQDGGRQTKKWCLYRTNNRDGFPNGVAPKNPIFPNASMDYQSGNFATSNCNHNYNFNHSRTNATHEQPRQPQSNVATTSIFFSSRLREPVTPDRNYRPEIQRQEETIYHKFNNKNNDYHNGAGTRNGHLGPHNYYYW